MTSRGLVLNCPEMYERQQVVPFGYMAGQICDVAAEEAAPESLNVMGNGSLPGLSEQSSQPRAHLRHLSGESHHQMSNKEGPGVPGCPC